MISVFPPESQMTDEVQVMMADEVVGKNNLCERRKSLFAGTRAVTNAA
jgi:hypothetical protein